MNKSKPLGTLLFYLSWPLIWFYGPLNIRVRVIIKSKSEILMVKNWFGPNSLQLPGGGKKFHEKPIDTAKREIKEELGIDLASNTRLVSDDISIVKSNGILFRFVYVVSEFSEIPKVKPNREISGYKWVDINSNLIPEYVSRHL